VTAETENRLLVVDLRTGAVTRRISVPGGPQYVAAEPGVAVVASPNAGAATLLEGRSLRPARIFSGFGAPHITEISPDGQHAFVVDDARGTVTVLGLADARRTSVVYVGAGAHHMTVSPDQRRVWVALGESARTIVIVDTSDIARPRVVGRFNPGFPAHDLSFAPDGRRVWVTSAASPDVAVFGAGDHRLLFRVPAGAPPQHIAFARGYAYLTSGYGSTIEQVAAATGKVIKRAAVPYGSFELDAADGYVVTTSLLNGKLAIYTPQLRLLRVLTLAPSTRDVAIAYP
jgi:DNA-binding beta-propeller fold protein YncE